MVKPLNKIIITLFVTAILSLTGIYSQQTVVEQSIKFIDNNNATLVGEDGLAMRTTDGGLNWVSQTTGITNVLYGNDNFDSLTSVAVGENGIILKTSDGGSNWAILTNGVAVDLYDIEVVDQTTAYACGNNGILLATYDKGDTWAQVYTQPGIQLYDVAFYDELTGFVVGSNSTVMRTDDGGVSWTNIRSSFDTYTINAIGIRNDMQLTIVGEGGLIYNSSNGGFSWTESAFHPDMDIKDILYFSQNDGIMVGSHSLIYRTTDGGANWTNVSPSSGTETLYSVAFSSVSDGAICGENGKKMYTTDGGATWSETPASAKQITHIKPGKMSAVNYPNPFNPSTKISFNMKSAGYAKVVVYDIAGRVVSELYNGSLKSGNQDFVFNAINLSSGAYIYRITTKINGITDIITGKMLLVK